MLQALPFTAAPALSAGLQDIVRFAAHGDPAFKDRVVLDVACGGGLVSCSFAPHVRSVLGVDVTPSMVARARGLAKEHGLSNAGFEVVDATALPFPDGAFSLVSAGRMCGVSTFPTPVCSLDNAGFKQTIGLLLVCFVLFVC